MVARELQEFDAERFNLRKLNDMEVKEQCQVKISNRFSALMMMMMMMRRRRRRRRRTTTTVVLLF
jgi:hypothetical protein